MVKNYYDLLGIKPDSNKDEIKIAFRKLSIKFHPDKNDGDPYFTNMFKHINEAYETLSNDIKRAKYDFEFNKHRNGETVVVVTNAEEVNSPTTIENDNLEAENKPTDLNSIKNILWFVNAILGLFVVMTKCTH
jgi:DnaJ-class molecular chaperone